MKRFYIVLSIITAFSCQEKNTQNDRGASSHESDKSMAMNEQTLSQSEIRNLIVGGEYKSWAQQDSLTRTSIHGYAKTYFNSALKDSQDAGSQNHPIGSIALKELYDNDQSTITGYALMQKISDQSGGDSWLWYEDLNFATDSVDFYDIGLGTCTGCHSSGVDFLRTTL